MAQRHGEMRKGRSLFAWVAVAVTTAAVLAGFLPVLTIGIGQGLILSDSYLLHVAGFTLLQASLSTLISVVLALPAARALAWSSFPGLAVIVRLLALPLALPAIVAVLGIVAVYGQPGLKLDIYGLGGILLAHVFFNFPMAARLFLSRLASIPPESLRLAAQLGFGPLDYWRLIEWPQIRSALPGIAILIFLLCTASFTVVLTLGGGPQATTLEVAIYQALRFDFDPPRAVGLAIIQLAICATLALLSRKFGGQVMAWQSLRRKTLRYGSPGLATRLFNGLMIVVSLLILLPPIVAVAVSGVANLALSRELLSAMATSAALGFSSAAIALLLCWAMAQAAARSRPWARAADVAVLSGLVMPPAVLATGWFILAIRFSQFTELAAFLVIAMGGLMALPFVYTTLAPAFASAARQNDRLCAGLGIAGFTRFRVIDLPSLRQPLSLAFLMGMIVSLGDLTAITLFGSQDLVTLPALIYRQMGSYRMGAASGTALILALFVLSLVILAERRSRQDD